MSEENQQNNEVSNEVSTESGTSTESGVSFHEATGDEFRNFIPEDIRHEKIFDSINNFNDMAKSYLNSQKLVGNPIRMPSENASAEAKEKFFNRLQEIPGVVKIPEKEDKEGMSQFYDKIGRPTEAKNYQFDLPQSLTLNEDKITEFKEMFYNLGFTNDQAQQFMNKQTQEFQSVSEQQTKNRESAERLLKEKWGPEFENKINDGKQVLKLYKEKYPDQVESFLNGPERNNPMIIEMLSEMAKTFRDSDHLQGSGKANYGITREEAIARINDLKNDVDNILWQKERFGQMSSERKQAINEYHKLLKIIG